MNEIAASEPPLTIGDWCKLNSGGPKMLVVDFDINNVVCAWEEYNYNERLVRERKFPRVCVYRVN